ncbi:DoxX family membrane protein [Anaerobacillus alkaliphilus]|uniref:DoxX family membrane protein n=1 Tax=Anaerobacillus alkaliphilus TaxID=1548597 RepID=A0A4Q0VTP2_9BACI|nr:DoxX family membrane protein [Anaerobacillus alkaliphilus]RXJ00403.1 DoxX family membrane protein [Anaerobacillus alkaliphilus]
MMSDLSIRAQHVKWFTEAAQVREPIENILTWEFFLLTIGIAAILAILPQIVPMLMELKVAKSFDRKLSRLEPYTGLILKYGTAIAIILQLLWDSILAPEIHLTTFSLILGITVVILLLIPHHIATKIGAIGLFALFFDALLHIGLFHMLDYAFYLALAFALLTQRTRFERLGMPALYLGTGLSLCWVAVEKWVYQEMSVDIVINHAVPTFGFDPASFVLLSAFIEFVVGYLLVVGVLNRLLALVLTLIFVSTTMLFGLLEVIGHFIVHIILITFIIENTSFYNPPVQMHSRKIDQIIFIFLNFIFVLATILLIYYRFA